MLKLEKVSKYYHNNGVSSLGLYNINLTLNKGEIVAITGESGSGKSTLLNVITKIDTFDEGEIYFNGEETSYFNVNDLDEFRKNKVGFIFQNYNILDSYPVLDNVMLPLLLKGLSEKEAKKKALELIEKVGLSSRVKSRGSQLSGGEKQRCVIARALASDCEILACDEPTGNLDSKTSKTIIDLIKDVAKDKLVLIVTHNFCEVKDIVTRVIKMSDGKIIEDIELNPCDKKNEFNQNVTEYQPLQFKVASKIAFKNIFYTPFKSLLLFLIFLVITFSFLFVNGLTNTNMNSDLANFSFVNTSDNYAFVYHQDKTTIDEALLSEYTYTCNNFAMQKSYSVVLGGKTDIYSEERIYYEDHLSNYSIEKGREASQDDEFILVVPASEYSYYRYLEDCLDSNLAIYANSSSNITLLDSMKIEDGKLVTKFKLVGLAVSSSLNSYDSLFATSCSSLKNFLNQLCVSYTMYDQEGNKVSFDQTYDFNDGQNELLLPDSYKNQAVSVYIESLYLDDELDVKYVNDIEIPTLVTHPYSNLSLKNYFAEVYRGNLILKTLKNNLTKKGFDVSLPSESNTITDIYDLITKISSIATSLFLSVFLILAFFITYFILSRVYASKTNDYQILRTLGITKHDLSHIVLIEVIFQGLFTTIFSFVIYLLLINTVPSLEFFKKADLFIYFLYFILMTIFSFALASRFNKKLFKFTISKSLKAGDDND